jgi:hypothetical protein
MTPGELEEQYAEAFKMVREHCDPVAVPLLDSLERAMGLTLAQVEAVRFHATLLDGMLATRLAVVERNDD